MASSMMLVYFVGFRKEQNVDKRWWNNIDNKIERKIFIWSENAEEKDGRFKNYNSIDSFYSVLVSQLL